MRSYEGGYLDNPSSKSLPSSGKQFLWTDRIFQADK